MISAQFFYAGTCCTGCTVTGHAEYAEVGSDVVCAYATSAVQTIANLMTEIYQLPVSAEQDEDSATIVIRLTDQDASGNAARLFAGLELQLGELEKAFPACIHLEHMEV